MSLDHLRPGDQIEQADLDEIKRLIEENKTLRFLLTCPTTASLPESDPARWVADGEAAS